MSKKKNTNTIRALLADGRNDKERIDTMTGITKMAPNSALYNQNAAVHAAVDASSGFANQLKAQGETETGLQTQLDDVKQSIDTTRVKYGRSIGVLRASLEAAAATVDELTALGVTGQIGATPPAPLTPPTGVKVALGKIHGQFHASAVSTHKKFGAQVSSEPVGPTTWVDLNGTGKRRLISGHPSGSLLWVRFRSLRGQAASEWCAPVSVTVP